MNTNSVEVLDEQDTVVIAKLLPATIIFDSKPYYNIPFQLTIKCKRNLHNT